MFYLNYTDPGGTPSRVRVDDGVTQRQQLAGTNPAVLRTQGLEVEHGGRARAEDAGQRAVLLVLQSGRVVDAHAHG